MKAISFPGSKGELKITGEDNIPCLRLPEEHLTCWQAGFFERLRFLFTGRVWFTILGSYLRPCKAEIKRKL
jgi:hypothetical protein